jgi:hypothetical protein
MKRARPDYRPPSAPPPARCGCRQCRAADPTRIEVIRRANADLRRRLADRDLRGLST